MNFKHSALSFLPVQKKELLAEIKQTKVEVIMILYCNLRQNSFSHFKTMSICKTIQSAAIVVGIAFLSIWYASKSRLLVI